MEIVKMTKQDKTALDITRDGYTPLRRTATRLAVGDTIEGRLVDIQEGQYSKIFIIQTDQGEVSIYGGAALDNILEVVDIGNLCRVKALDKKTSKAGRQYWDFEVAVKRKQQRKSKEGKTKTKAKQGGDKK